MPVAKGLPPAEAHRCAAEAETIVWTLIIIMIVLIVFSTFVFVASLGV
jgi:heme/copper-type cytochrome/quinol oxidase subunit 2